jgi:hypothetical protein
MKIQALTAVLIGLVTAVLPVSALPQKPTTDLERLYREIESYCISNPSINDVDVLVDLDNIGEYSYVGNVFVKCNNSSGVYNALIKNDGKIILFKNGKSSKTAKDLQKTGKTTVTLVRNCSKAKVIKTNVVNHHARDKNTGEVNIRYGAVIM